MRCDLDAGGQTGNQLPERSGREIARRLCGQRGRNCRCRRSIQGADRRRLLAEGERLPSRHPLAGVRRRPPSHSPSKRFGRIDILVNNAGVNTLRASRHHRRSFLPASGIASPASISTDST